MASIHSSIVIVVVSHIVAVAGKSYANEMYAGSKTVLGSPAYGVGSAPILFLSFA